MVYSWALKIFIIGVNEISEIGETLKKFPTKIGDEYKYTYGSEDPNKKFYRYFVLRTYPLAHGEIVLSKSL